QDEIDSRGGADLVERGRGHAAELPGRRQQLREKAGRIRLLRECRQPAGDVLAAAQRDAAEGVSCALSMEPSRQTTVLFADITGSTRLYETAGDSRAAEEIAVCMQKLREAVEAHGGRVVKTMGDAIMALFSTPNAAAAAAFGVEKSAMMEIGRAHV